MIRVTITEGNKGIPTPHVLNVTGLSDKRGRFNLWDKIQSSLAYGLDGRLTIDWSSLKVSPAIRRRLVVSHSPGR